MSRVVYFNVPMIDDITHWYGRMITVVCVAVLPEAAVGGIECHITTGGVTHRVTGHERADLGIPH